MSLVNTFRANNISYLTTDYIPDRPEEILNLRFVFPKRFEKTAVSLRYDDSKNKKIIPRPSYDAMWNAINDDVNRITDLEQLTRGISKLPCGHDDYPAMPVLANYIYEEIRKRWQ